MDSYDKYYQLICRICLTYRNEEMVCLTDVNSEDGLSCYGKAVEKFANVSIKISDELPQCMCQNCLTMLKQAIRFKLKCESSDKNLLNLYKQHKKFDSNLKEFVVDFCLFRDNFLQDISNNTSVKNSKDEFKCVNQETVSKLDKNPEKMCYEKEDDVDHIQDDSDCNSADEMLDQLEKVVLRFPKLSKSDYNVITKREIRQSQDTIQKVSNKSDKYVCNICKKVLANQHTYKYHMQRHNGFDFICEHCGKGFPLNVELQLHHVTRHGIGPYLQCPHCPFKAPKKFILTEHIRLHTGERPFTCDKCGLTFRRRAIWTKHMIYHKEKSIQCQHCPRKFHRIWEMRAHSNSVHERMYVYLCHKCDTTYAKPETVRRHLTERHGIPREMQGKIIRINKGKGSGFPEQ